MKTERIKIINRDDETQFVIVERIVEARAPEPNSEEGIGFGSYDPDGAAT